MRKKIVVIPGDMHAPGIGLSDADRQRLQADVEVVIHSAASISFFDHIHTALEQNYEVGRAAAGVPCRSRPACRAVQRPPMQC